MLGKHRDGSGIGEIDYGWIAGVLESNKTIEELCSILGLTDPEYDDRFGDLDSIQQQYLYFYAAFKASDQCYSYFCDEFADYDQAPELASAGQGIYTYTFNDLTVEEPESLPATPVRPRNPRLHIASQSRAKGLSPGLSRIVEWFTPTRTGTPQQQKHMPPATPAKK